MAENRPVDGAPAPPGDPDGIGMAQRELRAALAAYPRSDGHQRFERALEAILAGAVSTVPGASHAGITRAYRDGTIATAASSGGHPVPALDDLQAQLREGPCIDALWTAELVHAEDLAGETRWRRYAHRALELGVRSILSVRLYLAGDTLGALNLYSETPRGFTRTSVELAELFGSHAALALAAAERIAELERALSSRDLIGQAKGILMQRFGVDSKRAFDMLVAASQHTNVKLVDVADWLITTPDHELPGG